MLPNFFLIGAGKSGTSSLYEYLKQHPQVYMSPVKEPCFFAYENERLEDLHGMDWLRVELTRCGVKLDGVYDIQAYRQLFDGVASETAIGDASTHYLYRSKAPLRIKHYVPDARLLVILRHPADKAFSQFLMCVRDQREPHHDFALALREEESRIVKGWDPACHYVQTGFYFEQLKRYFDQFERDQIRVHLYEDLQSDALSVMKDIYRFLGVDDTFEPTLSRRYNVSRVPRSWFLHGLVTKPHGIKSAVKALLPRSVQTAIGRDLFGFVTRLNSKRPKLSGDMRQELTRIFRDDILRLGELIQRDLSQWLAPSGEVEEDTPPRTEVLECSAKSADQT